MHQWDDTGIVIAVARYGEQSAIVRVLTESHGLSAGMVKGAYAKKSRGIYQPGNVLHVHWQARLEEQLGTLRGELLRSCTAQLLAEPFALRLVNAACAMVLACVPERVMEKIIYKYISDIIDNINLESMNNERLLPYVRLEFALLQELGFGLDLSECAANGPCAREELVYVSPKSGRAVSREAGEPYKAKLLPLPAFLRDGEDTDDMRQMLDGLTLTGYFLEAWVLQPEGKSMPDARRQLVQSVRAILDK